MLLLLLTVGLSLLSVARAQEEEEDNVVVPAHPQKLLGKWYIIRWAGTIPIPREKRREPLPPFHFVVSHTGQLQFRMHIRKPSGCQLLKLPFSTSQTPGNYTTWWKHLIFIWLLTPRSYGVAYFEDKMNNQEINMMMLFSRTLDEDPGALSLFQELVETKGLEETEVTAPPQAEACELPRES
ncbi:major allergen Can f 1-like [Urocitellus parryii]